MAPETQTSNLGAKRILPKEECEDSKNAQGSV
jgi:hypothetical protein